MNNKGFQVRTDWADEPPTQPNAAQTEPSRLQPQKAAEPSRSQGNTAPAEPSRPVTPPETNPDMTGQRSLEHMVYASTHPRPTRLSFLNRRILWAVAAIVLVAAVCAVLFVPYIPVTYLADQQVYNENGHLCERVSYNLDGTVQQRFISNDEGMNETVTYTYQNGLLIKEDSLLFGEPYQQIRYEYRNGFAERITLLDAADTLIWQETATLDTFGPVSAVVQDAAGEILSEKTYTYKDGLQSERSVFVPQDETLTVTVYRYENGRLVQELTTAGEEVINDVSYSYNADGNLQLMTQSGKETHRYTYLYDYQTVRRNLLHRSSK